MPRRGHLGSDFADLLVGFESAEWSPQPINEFIFKVQTRCNINCTYCYVYNMGDESWRSQPKSLAPEIARQAARRIAEHAAAHDLPGVMISVHGGEPLLAGVRPVEAFLAVVREELGDLPARYSLQTNATLIDATVAAALADLDVGVGVSLDGPAAANRHRLNLRGQPTYAAARAGIAELTRHPGLLHGLLCVIPIGEDPIEVFDHLSSLGAPSIDFLLPHSNWSVRPTHKDAAIELGPAAPAPYGKWLISVFERWLEVGRPVNIRIFEDIIHLLLGGQQSFEGLGLSPSRLVVVEADGSIELVDHLGPTHPDAAITGLNVFEHSFDDALGHPGVACRQAGQYVLPTTCQECALVSVCGGGLITHRFLEEDGYRHPSVYCSDLFGLITHVRAELVSRLATVRS